MDGDDDTNGWICCGRSGWNSLETSFNRGHYCCDRGLHRSVHGCFDKTLELYESFTKIGRSDVGRGPPAPEVPGFSVSVLIFYQEQREGDESSGEQTEINWYHSPERLPIERTRP